MPLDPLRKPAALSVLLLTTAILAGCGQNNSAPRAGVSPPPTAPAPVQAKPNIPAPTRLGNAQLNAPGLSIEPGAVLLTGSGQTQILRALNRDSQGNPLSLENQNLEWRSSNPDKVSITPLSAPTPTLEGRRFILSAWGKLDAPNTGTESCFVGVKLKNPQGQETTPGLILESTAYARQSTVINVPAGFTLGELFVSNGSNTRCTLDDLSLVAAQATTVAPDTNLLTNPGLEGGLTGWGISGNTNFALEPGQGRAGSTALAVSPNGSRGQIYSDLRPNTAYSLRVWGKLEAAAGNCGLGYKFRNAAGQVQEETVSFTGQEYTQHSLNLTTSASPDPLEIYIWNAGNGRCFADDFSLTTRSLSTAWNPYGSELLQNGGFESDLQSWDSFGPQANLELVGEAHTGSKALRLNTNKAGQGQFVSNLGTEPPRSSSNDVVLVTALTDSGASDITVEPVGNAVLRSSAARVSVGQIQAGAVERLTLEGKTLIVSSTDTGSLEVFGLDVRGNRIALKASEVAWELTGNNRLTLAPNTGETSAVASITPIGFTPGMVPVVVRLKSNPNISTEGTITLASLQAGVKALNDSQLIFPPVADLPEDADFDTYALPGIQMRSGELYFGDFSADEVATLYDYDDTVNQVRIPVVTTTPFAAGDKLVSMGQGIVAGQVVSVTPRGNTFLLQVEQGSPYDLFQDFQATSANSLQTLNTQNSSRTLSTQSTARAKSAFNTSIGAGEFKCEFTGTQEFVTFDLKKNLKLPSIKPIFNYGGGADPFLEVGAEIDSDSSNLHLEPTVNVLAKGKAEFTCGYEFDVIFPLFGPLSAFVTPVVQVTPKFDGSISAESPDALGSLAAGFVVDIPNFTGRYSGILNSSGSTPSAQNVDFSYGGPALIAPIWEPKFPKNPTDPSFKAKFELSATFHVEAIAGLKPLAGKATVLWKKLPRFVRGVLANRQVAKLANLKFFDFLTVDLGPKVDLSWNNTGWEYDQAIAETDSATSKSVIKASLPGKIALQNSQLNKIVDSLKFGVGKLKFNLPIPKPILQTPEGNAIELGTAFRALKQSEAIKLNGRLASLSTAAALEPGKAYPLTLSASYPIYPGPLKVDSAPIFARLYYTSRDTIKTLGEDLTSVAGSGEKVYTISGNLKVPQSFCAEFPEGTTVYALGYNKLVGFETPGFLGSFKLKCGSSLEDSGFFKFNTVTFASAGNNDDAIVGKESCLFDIDGPIAKYVDITGSLTPKNGWTIESAQITMDGTEISKYPDPGTKYASFDADGKTLILAEIDPTNFNYSPMTGRSIPIAEHTFKYLATLKNAQGETRSSEFSKTVKFKIKKICFIGRPSPTPANLTPRGRPTLPPPSRGSRKSVTWPNNSGGSFSSGIGAGGAGSGIGGAGAGVPGLGSLTPRSAGSVFGDPHISTLDGVTYTTLATGDFVALRDVRGGGLELQMRHTAPDPSRAWASFNTAVALRVPGSAGKPTHTFEVRLLPKLSDGVQLLIDSQPSTFTPGIYTLDGTVLNISKDVIRISVLETDLPAAFQDTSQAYTVVTLGNNTNGDLTVPAVSLDVSVNTPTLTPARYRGLMGTPDGNAQNDLTLPNGEVVDLDAAGEAQMNNFVQQWSVSSNSAFQQPLAYQPQAPGRPNESDLETYLPELRAALQTECKVTDLEKVDPNFLRQLAFDRAAGRTLANILASGLCDSEQLTNALPPQLIAGVDLTGKVTATSLPNVSVGGVKLKITAADRTLCEVTSAEDGSYECYATFDLGTATTSNVTVKYELSNPAAAGQTQSIALKAGEYTSSNLNFEVPVDRVVRIKGRVLDAAGAPVVNAKLRQLSPYQEYSADGSGNFELLLPLPTGVTSGSVSLEAANDTFTASAKSNVAYSTTTSGITEVGAVELRLASGVVAPVSPGELISERRLVFKGQVLSSANNQGVGGVAVVISAPNSLKADCSVVTAADGTYSCDATLIATAGFSASVTANAKSPTTVDVLTTDLPGAGGTTVKNVPNIVLVTNPQLTGETRFYLTWGNSQDLDAHLWLPASTPNHIFYGNPGTDKVCPFAQLDLDNRSGPGPEIVRVKRLIEQTGTYQLWVRNYSGGVFDPSNTLVKATNADGSELLTIPMTPNVGTGTWWHVLNFDAATGEIKVINTVGDLVTPYPDTPRGCQN